MGAMVTVFDPQGNRGEIPEANLAAFVKAGGMPGVAIKAPDGTPGHIPANRYKDAASAGATILPFQQQDVKHPGFWATLLDEVTSMPGRALHGLIDDDPQGDPNLSQDEKWKLHEQDEKAAEAKSAARVKAHGSGIAGHLYDYGASANEMLGVNVEGEEKSAAEGDPGGVLGHAAVVPATLAATELGGRLFSAKLSRAIAAPAETFTKKPAATPVLDATGENVDYAGEKPPKPSAPLDATAENKPFAGGMDEWTAKPPRPLSDLDPATVARKAAARKAATPQPAPTPKPKPVPTPAPITPSGDPFLDRLRGIARDIEQRGEVKTSAESAPEASVPDPEQDLMDLLQQSMTPENLKRFRARKAAATVQ